jgi:hypothetical protein
MVMAFAPQFFLLIGIDLFLAGSIVVTLLEEHFPKALGYIFDLAAFIGFAQLWSGPEFLSSFGDNLQFYFSIGFAIIAAMSLAAANLYLIAIKGKHILSIAFAVLLTIPSGLIILFFASAYVNGLPIDLPTIPSFSWEQIYFLFAAAAILLVLLLIFGLHPLEKNKAKNKPLKPLPISNNETAKN